MAKAPVKQPPQRKLGVPTVIFSVAGLLVAGVLLIRLLDRPQVDPRTVEFDTKITEKDVEEWLLAAERLVEQRQAGSFRYRARTLSAFLFELEQQRKRFEGKLELVSLSYDRFLAITRAIRFARSALYIADQQRKQAERVAAERKAAPPRKLPPGVPAPPPPVEPPRWRPPQFKAGAQAETVKTYQAMQDKIERVLAQLELRVR